MVMARLLLRHPPLRAMAWFQIATLALQKHVRGVPSWVQRRLPRLYGLELVPGSDIGGGFYVAHPVGCVLVAESVGRNVTVIGQVTFGTRTDNRWPRISDRVFVGAGPRIFGRIEIGEGASVGSNAVVMESVSPGTTVVGIPARPVVKGATRQRDR
ncbi:MAG: serine acetyltransferase [Ilumatobacteraceae bacterium]